MLQKVGEQIRNLRRRPQHWVGSAGIAIAVGFTYFLAAQLGLALFTATERVAVFWPASGIAAGILISLGRWARVPVAVAVLASSVTAALMSDRNVWSALAFGLCNAGEALLVAWLIERWFGPAFNLESLRRVLGFFAAAAAATAVAALCAAGAMMLFGPSRAAFLGVWEVWFASAALGIVTVAPLLIGVAAAVRNAPSWRELLEGSLGVVVVTATTGSLLTIFAGPWSLFGPASLLFPLLLWLGYRCRPVFAAAAVFTIAAAIVWTTTNELGRYGDPGQSIAIRVGAARLSMLGFALGALALAALFAERKRVEEHQRKLVAELDHRVKNVLATVQAVAAHTMDASSSMEHFVAALDGRIRSLGSTHEILSDRGWLGLPLAELVQRKLAPYATDTNAEIFGPEVMLSAEAGQTMGMVLHELVTNAAKYGALSTSSGRVSIRWLLPLNGSASDRLVFKWRETGGPVVVSPSKSSYGMNVIRELIPYELGGTVEYLLSPEGAQCQMDIPLARLGCGSSPNNQDLFLPSNDIGKTRGG